MGSAFQMLCPKYSGALNPTAPTATRLWESSTFNCLLSTGEPQDETIQLQIKDTFPEMTVKSPVRQTMLGNYEHSIRSLV